MEAVMLIFIYLLAFDVHTTVAGGNTGEYVRPSKGALESAFGTHKPEEIAKYIVEHGEEKGMH